MKPAGASFRPVKSEGAGADPSRAIAGGVVEGLDKAAGATGRDVSYFGHGTTVATNALIQHRGVRTGLVTTAGFRDLLEIGRQRRPHLYDLQCDKPQLLVTRDMRIEVGERLRNDGSVVRMFNDTQTTAAIATAGRNPMTSCIRQ